MANPALLLEGIEVHVFVPAHDGPDPPTADDHDSPEYRQEVGGWLAALNCPWVWRAITLANLDQHVAEVAGRAPERPCIVLNLCDGIEPHAGPGLSVVCRLSERGIAYTGGDAYFYDVTTYKTPMKQRLAERGVSTPPFAAIVNPERDIPASAPAVGFPLLVKPVASACSYGIMNKAVVDDAQSAVANARLILDGVHGWSFQRDGVFLERFIAGREFTVLVVGSGKVYPPAERVFPDCLPARERLLSYERYWEDYEEETPLPPGVPLYHYAAVDEPLRQRLSETALQAYRALEGCGYARVDIRMDETGALFVLEVNANCGLSSDGQTSVSWILKLAGQPIHKLIEEILGDAWERAAQVRLAAGNSTA